MGAAAAAIQAAATPLGGIGTAAAAPAAGAATAPAGLGSTTYGSESQGRATTDAGDLLRQSPSAQGVETQRRSPIANESRVRGYHLGELVTRSDGQFWFPARQDLDTFLSKIDSGVIQSITVIRGPYTAQLGPGLAFIDIETQLTPRHDEGFEWNGRTSFNYKTNRQAIYGRQELNGGDQNWGFRMSYGQRTGQSYETGDDFREESAYDSRDVNADLGVTLAKGIRLEFNYMRLDQTGLDFPGQVFDTNFLVTNSYNLRLIMDNQEYFDHAIVQGFYNRTSLRGDAQNPGKRELIQQLNFLQFTGFTDIDQSSSGYRAAVTWGQPKCHQFTLGTDFLYLDGELNEFDNLFNLTPLLQMLGCASSTAQNFPIPRNHNATVGGLWFEDVLPSECNRFTLKTGGRLDYCTTNIDSFPTGLTCTQINQAFGRTSEFERDFTLFMAFATGEYKANDHWTWTMGFGHAERAPTETELYALGPFLAILQQGFTTVIGNPDLANEKLYQIDIGTRGEYERVRLGASGFASFVNDYITLEALDVAKQGIVVGLPNVANALTVKFVNTDLAFIWGFETYAEVDVNDWLTPFVTVSYANGTDETRDHRGAATVQTANGPVPFFSKFGIPLGALGSPVEGLPGFAPVETRIGLRFHEAAKDPRYGVELAARIDAAQDHVAESLGELPSAGFVVWDVRSYWRVHKGVLLTAGVENIFDRFYREALDLRTGDFFSTSGHGVYQPGTNAYFGMELTY
jgi:outer membrane receptor protein involved in Fe transport